MSVTAHSNAPFDDNRTATEGTDYDDFEEDDDCGGASSTRRSGGDGGLRRTRPSIVRRGSYRSSMGASSHSSSMGFELEATGGLSPAVTQKLFPYHVMINYDFEITQIGKNLPRLIGKGERDIVGTPVDQLLRIAKPLGAVWKWDWLRKLEDQSFSVELTDEEMDFVRFKASVVLTSEHRIEAMIVLSPDANNLNELRDMRLTLSDLPAHGAYRDAVFLREHLSTQMNNALKMEKLSRNLEREKALLEELLPEHAAEGLRRGRAVEPMIHPNVTVSLFVSTIILHLLSCSHRKQFCCYIRCFSPTLLGLQRFAKNFIPGK